MNSNLLRFFCIVGVIVSIFGANFANNFDIFTSLKAFDIKFYFLDNTYPNLDYQINGVGYVVDCNNPKDLINTNFEGVSFKTTLKIDELRNKLNFKTISSQMLENKEIIYGFSNKLEKSINIKNQKVNLEFVIFEEYILVGYPLLLGSY